MSRTYSTITSQWTAVDPLVAWGPQELVNNPGNWNPYCYCHGDSMNCVDESGYSSSLVSREIIKDLVKVSRGILGVGTGTIVLTAIGLSDSLGGKPLNKNENDLIQQDVGEKKLKEILDKNGINKQDFEKQIMNSMPKAQNYINTNIKENDCPMLKQETKANSSKDILNE